MGRRRSRSASPSKSPRTKKRAKPSSTEALHTNPFWAVFGTGNRVALDDRGESSDNDAMDVDDDNKNPNSSNSNNNNDNHTATDRIFDEMLRFTELSSRTKSKPVHEASTAEDEEREKAQRTARTEATVRTLLGYLGETTETETTTAANENEKAKIKGTPTSTRGFVTASDVAGLLLPWSVKGILQAAHKPKASSSAAPAGNASRVIHWKTLDACLALFLDRSGDSSTTKNNTNHSQFAMLTLSTLHKIVPIALALSLQADDNDNDNDDDMGSSDSDSDNVPSNYSLTDLAGACYCRLADHLYRPPFDVVCDSLLPILASAAASATVTEINHDKSGVVSRWHDVAASTLRLMESRLASANPKKSFQLLVRPVVFRDLARVHECSSRDRNNTDDRHRNLLVELIRSGLFGLEHHMDGFRSLQLAIPVVSDPKNGTPKKKKKEKQKTASPASSSASATATATAKSFRGYQEGLFQTLEGFLDPNKSQQQTPSFEGVEVSFADTAAVCSLCPLLLRVFLEQASKIQAQQAASRSSHKKSKAVNKMGQLQFRFFACLSGYLLKGLMTSEKDATTDSSSAAIEDDSGSTRASLFCVLGKNLDLLLRHNIYQPSLGNHAERSFLDSIGSETVRQLSAGHPSGGNGSTLSPRERNHGLVILDVLIKLNHTLLHEQLADVVALCLTRTPDLTSSSDESSASWDPSTEAGRVLATVIGTYGKLRQLDYFYQSLFRAASVLSDRNDLDRLGQLSALVDDNEVSLRLGRAIQESPIQQLKQIFSDLNASGIAKNKAGGELSPEVALVASSVFAKALIGLLRNVRIDSNSSNEIYPICNEILEGSVAGLIGSNDKEDANNNNNASNAEHKGYLKNAVMLCAWTINLKNRCEFWVGNKQINSSNEDVSGIPPAIRCVLKDTIRGTRTDVHRDLSESLKFLACQRIQQLHGECYEKQRLAYASDAEQYSTERESAEARELVGFILEGCAPGVDDPNTTSVTNHSGNQWVVLAESISIWAPYANRNDIDSFLNQLLRAVAVVDRSQSNNRQQMMSILNDSNFYEIPNVSEWIGTNVVTFVASNVRKIVALCERSSPRHVAMVCPLLHEEWKTISFREIAKIRSSGVSLPSESSKLSEINELFLGCLRVLETFDDGSIPVWEHCGEASNTLESIFRIESVCQAIHVGDHLSLLETTARLVSTLRVAASRVLNKIQNQSDNTKNETENENWMILLRCNLENSLPTLDKKLSSKTRHGCIHSCSVLMESLVRQCMNCNSGKLTMEMVEVLESTFEEAEVAKGSTEYLVLINYAMTLIKEFHESSSNEGVTERFLLVVKKQLWVTAQKYCFEPPKDADFFLQNQSMVFIAELLRLSSTYAGTHTIPFGSSGSKIVNKLRDAVARDCGHPVMQPVSYLVGCFAMNHPSGEVQQDLASALLDANLEGHSEFLTPLCALARRMEIKEYDDFLGKLTSSIVEVPATTTRLRIMRMVILSATRQSHIDLVAKHSPMIMNNCLQVMTQVARQIDTRPNSITEASLLIVEMASRKDIMILRESDIALVLARITSAIALEEGREFKTNEVQIKAYEAGFSLVSFFLQRFSKQMHSCVPSLIISLTAMLQFTLRKSLSEHHMPNCGQKFSRLCELLLPHGDVYKKHVICLILRFVNSLQGDMNAVCKKSLLPGIYCLLDIIQEHESMQLNSMLDEECRAILRSIHEGYKKIHVYKGQ